MMSQRSGNGTKNHGTYQSASFAQCSGYDNLRSISLKIHLLIFYEPENRRTEASKLKAILTYQNSSKIEKRSCQLYASTLPSRTTKLRLQMCSSSTEQSRAAGGSYSALEKQRAWSAILKSACNVHLKI